MSDTRLEKIGERICDIRTPGFTPGWNAAVDAALEAIASESLAHSSEEGEFYITDRIIAAVEKLKKENAE